MTTEPSPAANVVVLVGNPRPGSRTRSLAEAVTEALLDRFGEPRPAVQVLELAEIVRVSFGPEPAYGAKAGLDPFAAVRSARLLVVATPAYKGSYTGLLKIFLDQFGHRALADVTAVPVAVAASQAHADAAASALRAVLAELGADVVVPPLAVQESRLADKHQIAKQWADPKRRPGAAPPPVLDPPRRPRRSNRIMTLLTLRGWRRGAAGIVAAVLIAGIPAATPATAAAVDTTLEWYDVTAAAIATGTRPQVTSSRAWAISWLAAARAIRTAPTQAARHYQDAALASAVHTALGTLIPEAAPTLDSALQTTLDRIPDGRAKDSGVTAGQAKARMLLAHRAGDGLDPASVNPPYLTPDPAPGIWQPTPPTFTAAQQAGTRFATPFLLDRADQYRPGPPPTLDSQRYRADLAEVRAYGAADSNVRTTQQTDTATFWLGSSLTLYTGILRAALAQSTQPDGWRASLVAIFHIALVDTQIATSDTKYAYRRWRPITAIQASADGDPQWTPLHATPAHPDYPSGHNTYSGAAEQVLTTLVGARARQPYTITSPSQPGATRTYTDWRRPTLENVDARVWSGIHTRTADEAGVRLGRDVAAHTIRNAARLFAR